MPEMHINPQPEAANPPPAEANLPVVPAPDNEYVDIQAVHPELPPGAEWVDDMLFDQEIQNAFDVVFNNEGGQQNMEVEQVVPVVEENNNQNVEEVEDVPQVEPQIPEIGPFPDSDDDEEEDEEEEEDPSEVEGASEVSSQNNGGPDEVTSGNQLGRLFRYDSTVVYPYDI